MPKLKPWEERAPAAAGATPPQRTHESHSPRPQHLPGGGGGGAAAAQPPEGASKPPHRCLPRRRTRARAQAATGGGAANPPRRARSLLRPDRAAICASGGKRADKAQRRGGRASDCRAPRAHRDVWRGRQRRRSHNERRSGGIAPHRRERHSPSAEPIKAPEGA